MGMHPKSDIDLSGDRGHELSFAIGIMEYWNDGLRLVEPTPRRE